MYVQLAPLMNAFFSIIGDDSKLPRMGPSIDYVRRFLFPNLTPLPCHHFLYLSDYVATSSIFDPTPLTPLKSADVLYVWTPFLCRYTYYYIVQNFSFHIPPYVVYLTMVYNAKNLNQALIFVFIYLFNQLSA